VQDVVSPNSALFTYVQADSWDEHCASSLPPRACSSSFADSSSATVSDAQRVRIKLLWDGGDSQATGTTAHRQDPGALLT